KNRAAKSISGRARPLIVGAHSLWSIALPERGVETVSMAKFIQVNQWDRKYEKADKIVVNTEQIVQVNPAATDHRAIILTVRGEFTVDHTVEELASMLLAKELKCCSIGTPASYARTRIQRKISASVAGFQQSMRCGGQPPAD